MTDLSVSYVAVLKKRQLYSDMIRKKVYETVRDNVIDISLFVN